MTTASKTAIGGMATALSVIMLIPTALEIFVYALPAFAGIVCLFCVIELQKKWAFGVYVAVSLISLLVVPNKEAVVLYVAFFGYYPIVKSFFEKVKSRFFEYVMKFTVFNVSVAASYFVLIKLFGLSVENLFGENLTTLMFAVLLVLFNLMFIIYDIYLTKMYIIYINRWQRKFHKMFRFK